MSKFYLGDGAYADFDGFYLVLTTGNGIRLTNRIYLQPGVLAALNLYIEKLREELGMKG